MDPVSPPLIRKIYEVDPLTCPRCQGRMKVIAFIEDEEVISKILGHLGLWEAKVRSPPVGSASSVLLARSIDCSDSQLPASDEHIYVDPVYPDA